MKGITKQCLTGIWTIYDLLDLQTQILPSAFSLEQQLCLKDGPTNHKLISYQVNNCISHSTIYVIIWYRSVFIVLTAGCGVWRNERKSHKLCFWSQGLYELFELLVDFLVMQTHILTHSLNQLNSSEKYKTLYQINCDVC